MVHGVPHGAVQRASASPEESKLIFSCSRPNITPDARGLN